MQIPKAPLPAKFEQLIDESVERFKKRWGVMIGFAEAGGHIEAYREELDRIVRVVMDRVDAHT